MNQVVTIHERQGGSRCRMENNCTLILGHWALGIDEAFSFGGD
ncbi:hypothetical protein FDUTEX481_07378 [Tolypothrix sp. PCC 7601]|nr:hypothetical protein FDUTEX481_07378 [Tolypothrix sp. PCC 7601]